VKQIPGTITINDYIKEMDREAILRMKDLCEKFLQGSPDAMVVNELICPVKHLDDGPLPNPLTQHELNWDNEAGKVKMTRTIDDVVSDMKNGLQQMKLSDIRLETMDDPSGC